MRNTLNKVMQPLNKNRIAGTPAGKDTHTMNKDLQKVADATATIDTNIPQIREEYVQSIESAQKAQLDAKKEKEEALTGVEFDNACEKDRNAHEKEIFFKRKLEELDFTPRMDEKEYFAHVATVQKVMDKAAANYREKALKLMNELVSTHKDYMQLVNDADQVLEDLDRASNVLQSKHRYREYTYQGAPSQFVQDYSEWRNHTVRYGSGKARDMVVEDGDGKHNRYLNKAWNTADQITESQKNTVRYSV